MLLSDFDYLLPPELIAQKPSEPRDSCNLMILNRSNLQILHDKFFNITRFLKKGDVIVFNDSKVIPARILFNHGSKNIEIFLIKPKDDCRWYILGKPGKALRLDAEFNLCESLSFKVEEVFDDGRRLVKFSLAGKALKDQLFKLGAPPFPPYIKNPVASFDDYQTIYANKEGSVAAPTAGLHFTARLLKELTDAGIQLEFVTLHVGLGTFLPIKVEKIEEHKMHEEFFELDERTALRLNKAKKEGRRIIAVGTTSVRVLESAFDGYNFKPGIAETGIYIYPGYNWKCVSGIVTNFHLPKSSLMLLVSSFAGKDLIMNAYAEAIRNNYKFYSFGDAMLIL